MYTDRVLDYKRRLDIKSLSRQTAAVLLLAGLAAVEIVVFLLLLHVGFLKTYVGDNAANVYLPAASHILTAGTYNDLDTIWYSTQAPGYSFFLAFAQQIADQSYLSLVVCLQILLNYFVAIFLLFLGHRETSTLAGWLAAALWLLFPPAVVISTFIAPETLFTALLVLSIAILIRSLSQPGHAWLSFVAGLSLGLATLVRATTLLLPVFLLALLLFLDFRKAWPKCALFLIGMYLVVLPWAVRNRQALDEPIVVQSGFGQVFLQGSRAEYFTISGKTASYPLLFAEAAKEGLVKPTDGKLTSFDRWRLSLGLRNYRIRLAHEPMSLFPFLTHKFARLWYGAETGTFSKQFILGVSSLLALPAGIYQIWLWRKDRRELSVVLSLLLLYFIGIHWVALPEFRYMLPVCPFLTFAASHRYLIWLKGLRAQ